MPSECSLGGCDRPRYARSWCKRHYRRWQRHGNPLVCFSNHGRAQAFVLEAASSDSDECIIWPLSRYLTGYGQITYKGLSMHAHRAVCIEAHGPPPSDGHHAIHSCGNGKDGCVNPKHLRWGTPAENGRDTVAHGTSLRGSKNHSAKLSEQDVLDIVAALGQGSTVRTLADRYGVAHDTVRAIKNGRTWSWLTDDQRRVLQEALDGDRQTGQR